MDELIHDAKSELRRLDHLIHVSLKYTRTVDVLISVLKRFISCIDFTMDALFVKAEQDKGITVEETSPVAKSNQLKKIYEEKIIQDMLNNYQLFRRLVRAKYTKRNEFRRYVTMTVDDNGTIVEIDIDKVVEYHELIKKYVEYISKFNEQ